MKDKIKNAFVKFFTNNLFIKVAAILAGLALWAALSNTQDPVVTRTLDLPIEYLNADILRDKEGLVPKNPPTYYRISVNVHQSRQRYAVASLFSCTADLTDHSGGDLESQRVHINVTQLPGTSDTVLDWSYSRNDPNITFAMEKYITKTFTVEAIPEGDLGEGMVLENSIVFNPGTITVRGPYSAFSKLNSVKAVVDYTRLSGGGRFSEELEVHLYDANESIIPNTDGALEMSAETVTLTAAVDRILTVPVEAEGVTGMPANGIRHTLTAVSPQEIRVVGLPEKLAGFTKLTLPREDINVTGISENRDYTLLASNYLPEGVSLYETEDEITVHVYVESVLARRYEIPLSSIEILNRKDNMIYEIFTQSVPITVVGFAEDLDRFDTRMVRLFADLESYTPGNYSVPIRIENNSGYTLADTEDLALEVQITMIETEPPTTSAEPTTEPTTTSTEAPPETPEETSSEPEASLPQEEPSETSPETDTSEEDHTETPAVPEEGNEAGTGTEE